MPVVTLYCDNVGEFRFLKGFIRFLSGVNNSGLWGVRVNILTKKIDPAIESLGKNNPFPERPRNQGSLILIFLRGQGDHIEGHFEFFHRMHFRIFCQESPIKNIPVYKIIRDYCDIDITSGFCGVSA